MSSANELRKAERHLKRRDPVMAEIIRDTGKCRIDRYWRRQPFPALLETIVSQQISVAAAATIFRRFKGLYGGRPPSARALLATSDEALRSAGLSRPKVRYLRDLAEHVTHRKLSFRALERMDDDQVREAMTAVKGIGCWTAEVFMMFRLGRLDLVPVDDIGLQEGAKVLYRLEDRPDCDELARMAEPWRPYRSVGCWYLWQGRRRAVGLELR